MNSLEMEHIVCKNCCRPSSITLRLILLANLESVMDKCQTGVMSTTCYSPTDVVSDWTLIVCSGVLWRRLSSWLMDMRYMQSVILRVFRRGHCKYLFVSKQNAAIINEWIFWATVLNDCVLHGSSLHSFTLSLRFLSTNVSQGSVTTRLRCVGIFNYYFARNLLLSLSL